MCPSEYAFRDDSVTRAESTGANCKKYLSGPLYPSEYIHCNGSHLDLVDSNTGQEMTYISVDYYVWTAESEGQLLFIFPTRVSLTTITVHYYSDSVRGLPRLRFYAVPDDFHIWDAPTTSSESADVAAVPSGGEPAGHRNVSINVNLNTKKVLMYKYGSNFQLVVSEVQFFNCNCEFARIIGFILMANKIIIIQ